MNHGASGRDEGPLTGLRGHRVLNPDRMRERREEILAAFAHVVAQKGYDSATLDDVAARMGTSKAVIYYQFRSKEELYVALTEQVHEEAVERLRNIAASEDSPEKQLHAALTDLVHLGWKPLHYAAIRTRRPASLQPEAREHLRSLDRQYEGLFIEIVQRGIDSGVFARHDARFVAFTLINAVHSIFRWARPDGALSPETFEVEVPNLLLEGVLKR